MESSHKNDRPRRDWFLRSVVWFGPVQWERSTCLQDQSWVCNVPDVAVLHCFRDMTCLVYVAGYHSVILYDFKKFQIAEVTFNMSGNCAIWYATYDFL